MTNLCNDTSCYKKKILVSYVFHIYNQRVEHFIKNAIFYDENVDFMIISNNKDCVFDAPDYVTKIFRDNIGYDFGGWSDAIMKNSLYQKYTHFIFINSSVIGPFLRPDFIGKWTDIYINGLNDNTKLFGSTINNQANPCHGAHIQSYIFAMNLETLQYLMNCGIFNCTNYIDNFGGAINREVVMSRKIIENGWNIGSLEKYYKDVDFTFKTKNPHEYNISHLFTEDNMWIQYRNVFWNEHDLVFIKGNRIPELVPNL
jgi:hypothetical protein